MDEHFCLTSHMIFVRDWDEKIIAQWGSIESLTAIISVYPNSTEHLTDHGVDDLHFNIYKIGEMLVLGVLIGGCTG